MLSLQLTALLPEQFKAIRQFRLACPLVRELSDQQREWLGVTGDPQRAGIHRIEARRIARFRSGGHNSRQNFRIRVFPSPSVPLKGYSGLRQGIPQGEES
jgi:hypothetical protein